MAAPQSIIKKHATHLEGWIQSCNQNHGADCQVDPIAGRPPHHIPDWVIDTEDGCIVRGCSIQRYVALSYVWGSAAKSDVEGRPATTDRLLLQKDNIADFCRQGFLRSHILGSVPVVIRDAIDLVQLSGFRYLWVDSLCIVQHDDTTRDRVGLMNEIYSGAYFTIIAAASTEGLCGNRDYDNQHIPPLVLHQLHNKLLCSHWASRGWTFQEQLLSSRSIVFLDDACFWDCQREMQCPRSSFCSVKHLFLRRGLHPSPQVQQPPSDSSRYPIENTFLKKVYRKIFCLRGREKTQHFSELTSLSCVPDFRFYVELVCRYSNRDLTYDQDVLPAFSGVLEVLSRRSFRGGFICGLPALFLDSALLWQPLLKARRRSPVRTAAKFAPMAPLPSWSWAGWQCKLDPDSLIAGLDYMTSGIPSHSLGRFSRTEEVSWRTWKLVDWSTISDDRSANPVDEPALLQSLKGDWEEADLETLPIGWSRGFNGAFVHANNPTVGHQHPLPTQDTDSATATDESTSLLSCTTRIATLRVRRVLFPDKRAERMKTKMGISASMAQTSVFATDLYDFQPQLHTLCPVMTLEDKNGSWAGVMTIMEDETSVQSGSELKMIAISTGSAFHEDVAVSYPEKIDSKGDWCYGRFSDTYLFSPLDWRDDNGGGSGQVPDAGINVGPFKSARSDQLERYHFYNVLWVETFEGVMYRKAAGRVPKEIWELNCGEPTKIVLG